MRISDWSSDVCSSDLSAFQLTEQNASGLGNGYAGSAAIAENASTIYFNPAGMTRLPGVNVSLGAVSVTTKFKSSDEGSTRSEERGVGKEGVSPRRSRWSPYPQNKKNKESRTKK